LPTPDSPVIQKTRPGEVLYSASGRRRALLISVGTRSRIVLVTITVKVFAFVLTTDGKILFVARGGINAQDGVDHVDGYRTEALVVSPYTRRGAVDLTFYAHQSILKID